MFSFLYNLSSFELACLTVVVGVLVAVIIKRLCKASPGGVLSAAILLLAASDSLYWALMLLVITPLVSKLYDRFFDGVSSGREPMFILAGLSIVLATAGGLILQALHVFPISGLSFPLGMIFPAITAAVMRKQGILETYRYLGLAVVLTLEAIIIIYGIGRWLNYDFSLIDRLAEPRQTLQLSWSALFALFAVFVGYFIYRRYKVKAIGYITLPLLATLVIVSPVNALLVLVTAVIVYFLTLPMRRALTLSSTSRQAYTTVIAVAVVWTIDYVLLHRTESFSPYVGTGLFAAIVVSVMVNEHIRYGVRRAFPILIVSLAAMIVIQISGSFILNVISADSSNLRYYIVRQATEPKREQQR